MYKWGLPTLPAHFTGCHSWTYRVNDQRRARPQGSVFGTGMDFAVLEGVDLKAHMMPNLKCCRERTSTTCVAHRVDLAALVVGAVGAADLGEALDQPGRGLEDMGSVGDTTTAVCESLPLGVQAATAS